MFVTVGMRMFVGMQMPVFVFSFHGHISFLRVGKPFRDPL